MTEGERPRVGLSSSPVRCPYCHDDVAVESGDWIACADCLARHHRECWSLGSKCGACGRARTLEPTEHPEARSAPAAAPRTRAPAIVAREPGAATGAASWLLCVLFTPFVVWGLSVAAVSSFQRAVESGRELDLARQLGWLLRYIELVPCVLPLLTLFAGIFFLVRRRRA